MNNKKTTTPTDKKSPSKRGLFWSIYAIIIVILIGAGCNIAYVSAYQGRIFTGVKIGNLYVGGMTPQTARNILENRIDSLYTKNFVFYLDEKKISIPTRFLAPNDPDVARDLFSVNYEVTIANALNVGRNNNPLKNVIEQLNSGLRTHNVGASVKLREADLLAEIERALELNLTPIQNSKLKISWEGEIPTITATEPAAGTIFNSEKTINELETSLAVLELPEINLDIINKNPSIFVKDVEPLIDEAKSLLSKNLILLKFENKTWEIDKFKLSEMIEVDKDEKNKTYLHIGGAELDTLLDRVAQEINQSPKDAKFQLENNHVVEFQNSSNGIELDKEATKASLNEAILTKSKSEVNVIVKTTEPKLKTADVNDLGIKEILGVGTSNFKGSPKNRIKNIQNGARLLHGILIAPEEEFSLIGALKPVTIENGYLPELVIKGDEIKPEVGGGLCQIGTTTFRTIMNSGLPVTKRSNHSLVVSYYNDPANGNPGTDATIYDPAPDLRFINDTGNYILFATSVDTKNNELKFTFWGTSDGRKGSYSAPVVERWIPTGPTREVETTNLEVGKRSCQSRHPGADTSFTYTVKKSDGSKIETVYGSHYRPLPEICLVGVPEKTETATETTSETEPLTNTEAADL